MTALLSIIGILVLLFILSILFCMYEIKKGQIKMKDNEIPIENVIFKEDYNIHELF